MNITGSIKKSASSRRGIRLYDMSLPIWMIALVPSMWKLMLPISLLFNGIVLMAILAVYAHKHGDSLRSCVTDWLRVILPNWIAHCLSCLIAAGFLLFWGMGPTLLMGDLTAPGAWWGANVAEPMMENPFEKFFAVLFVLLGIGLAGLMIYFFNKNMSLRLTRSLDVPEIRKTALILALTTAPWWMLLPSVWFW